MVMWCQLERVFEKGFRANLIYPHAIGWFLKEYEAFVTTFGQSLGQSGQGAFFSLLSLVNMKLKAGEAELAHACYAKLLEVPELLGSAAEQQRVQAKLAEARQLHADVREILEAPQAGLFNTPDDRERTHRKLVERAKAANERGERAEAQRLFLEAWPLLFRVATLVSAANMMAHLGGRSLRVAIGVYASARGPRRSHAL